MGIKDTDDSLVASTLICLSELVPILGADTVVGGKRTKLFTDGRPKSKSTMSKSDGELFMANKILPDFHCSERIYPDHTGITTFDQNMALNERPSPVGGESNDDVNTGIEVNKSANVESEDEWDDWENTNPQLVTVSLEESSEFHIEDNDAAVETNLEKETVTNNVTVKENKKSIHSTLLQKAALEAKKNIVDISELDIKNQKVDLTKKNDEIDFFADMMPVIEKQKVVSVEDNAPDFLNKLSFVPDEGDDENEAWGESWNE